MIGMISHGCISTRMCRWLAAVCVLFPVTVLSAACQAQNAGLNAPEPKVSPAEKGGLPEGILLSDPSNVNLTTRVKYALRIRGTLITPSGSGTTDWDLNSSANFEFDQRRFESAFPGAMKLRAVRHFHTAETNSIVGKNHKNTVSLPAQSRLIQLHGSDLQLVQFSPDVRLTRPQVDVLQFPCDPLAATGLLPERRLSGTNEKWNADDWVVPMLTGIDAVVRQNAGCSLKSLTDKEAVVEFLCEAGGAITGSPTEVTLSGELTVDRRNNLITALRAELKEKRGAGTVSPGLDVTADIQWTQTVVTDSPAALPDSIPESLPSDRQLLLTLVTPWRVLMLHNRDWHIFHETSELMMLRMLHNGALLAQCNIAAAPLMAAGKFTSEPEYVAEVEKALQSRGGRIVASEVRKESGGWRVHHVKATGNANNKTLVWDYYLCSTSTGEQISLVFSHAEEDDAAFHGVPDQMISSLTLRPLRPKVALPR